jgi:hypothetical protein
VRRCDHLDIGICGPCELQWDQDRAAMERDRETAHYPGRDMPFDRRFPDAGAWVDTDGTIYRA